MRDWPEIARRCTAGSDGKGTVVTGAAAGIGDARSARWFAPQDTAASSTARRSRAEGFSQRGASTGRPVVGICNSWSELVNCNLHFRGLAEAVKRGVLMAGGPAARVPDDRRSART